MRLLPLRPIRRASAALAFGTPDRHLVADPPRTAFRAAPLFDRRFIAHGVADGIIISIHLAGLQGQATKNRDADQRATMLAAARLSPQRGHVSAEHDVVGLQVLIL